MCRIGGFGGICLLSRSSERCGLRRSGNKLLDVYDRQNPRSPVQDVDFAPLARALSQLPALKHLSFTLEATPPDVLLAAVGSAPHVDFLEFRNARFDGPSLVHHFVRMKLKALTISVGLYREANIDLDQEKRNIAEILTSLAEQLVQLEISGDLVSFRVLEKISWPNLLALRYTDNIPFGEILPMSAVVALMPRLRTLGYYFSAAPQFYKPGVIFCSKNENCSSLLSTTHPDLQKLTMSNIVSGDAIFDQLPAALRVLRVLALRDDLRNGEGREMPLYPYFPISHRDAFRIINKAGHLRHLVELAITLEDCPSPDLLSAVADSCRGLRILELTQGMYDLNREESPYTMKSLAQPLKPLKFLYDLRITVWFGPQKAPFRRHATRLEVRTGITAAAEVFAEILPQLATISFSLTNISRYDGTRHPLTWYYLVVHDSLDGHRPVAEFDGYREYYSHSASFKDYSIRSP
ncbi:hypothetical protein Hypma_008234 [Hypsizygus marmoreus]|uniref:F-box domain-containing protein n=1 Tax=Hypsizygus marmoreus TaxID=39966 RepID=A0A369JYF6_HYPMA|nr:hypothetical protein Hypma_008234 [Hypsizygus marmoreus]